MEKNGILFLKSRISEGQRFVQAAELEGTDILRSQGINVLTPVLDRHSPLSYSIANHIHCNVAKHSGYETCSRVSQGFVHIVKGTSLYQELAEDCIVCKKARKRFIQAAMGPIHPSKFVVAPPFWTTQADLWGPMVVYVPGREKNTRSSKTLDAACYVLVFVCCLSKAVNLQIIESKSVDGICDGITRLACERGLPSHFLVDQEGSLMKSLREGKMTVIDLQNHLQTKVSPTFAVCPVSGHNAHGLVERKILTAQLALEKTGAGNMRLHATGLQTLCKLIECDLNNTPMGLSYGRSETNTPLMKLVSPNTMLVGRINARSPIGPFSLPAGPKSLMARVEACYRIFYKEYVDTMLVKYLLDLQPKWFKNDRDVKVGDVVYFRKRDTEFDGPWTVGMVERVVRSIDGVIRRATVKYFNSTESSPRFTDRSIRKIVKLFNLDDGNWQADMDMVKKNLDEAGFKVRYEVVSDDTEVEEETLSVDSPEESNESDESHTETVECNCCCQSHCEFVVHCDDAMEVDVSPAMMFAHTVPDGLFEGHEESQYTRLDLMDQDPDITLATDSLLACVTALDTDLDFSL